MKFCMSRRLSAWPDLEAQYIYHPSPRCHNGSYLDGGSGAASQAAANLSALRVCKGMGTGGLLAVATAVL